MPFLYNIAEQPLNNHHEFPVKQDLRDGYEQSRHDPENSAIVIDNGGRSLVYLVFVLHCTNTYYL